MVTRNITPAFLLIAVLFLSQVHGQSNQQNQNNQPPNNNNNNNNNNHNNDGLNQQQGAHPGNQHGDNNQNYVDYGPVQGIVNPFINAINHLSYGIFDMLKKGFEFPVNLLQTGQTSFSNVLNSFQRPQFQQPTPSPLDVDQLLSVLSQLRPNTTPNPQKTTVRTTQRPNNNNNNNNNNG